VFKERIQLAAIVALVVLVIAGLVGVVLLKDHESQAPRGKLRADLEAASIGPNGILHFLVGPDDFVFRYQAGSCTTAGGPEFAVTDDKGWSFKPIRLPQVDDGTGIGASTPTIASVASVTLEGRRRFVVSGADDKCGLHTFVTTDGGISWTQKAFKPDSWYVDPKSGVVYSPIGPANVDCPGIANLSSFDDETAVAYCIDGSVYQSSDGETWDRSGSTDEPASAVFFDSPDDGYAVWPDGNCQSTVFRTTDGGSSWSERGCVYADILIPGIGGSDDALMAGGNGPVWTSDDGGKTWTQPTRPEDDDAAIRQQVNQQAGGGSAAPSDQPGDTASDEPTDEPTDESSDEPTDGSSDDSN
jgi:hypothetical protein